MERLRKRVSEVASCNVVYSGSEWPLKGGGEFVNYAQASGLPLSIAGRTAPPPRANPVNPVSPVNPI